MFTGLIETVGQVVRAEGRNPMRLTVDSALGHETVPLGASIAIDGCCLTVVAQSGSQLSFEAATETLARTTIGGLRAGAKVNLERSLKVGDRLGGHWVLGHVDGIGVVQVREQRGSALYLGIRSPHEVHALIAPQGSVTVAGASLTVTDVDDNAGTFYVGLIPHTLEVTTLGDLKVGAQVNVEADVVARYLQRLSQGYQRSTLTAEALASKGFA